MDAQNNGNDVDESWCATSFSTDNRYLVVLRGTRKPGRGWDNLYYGYWMLMVYEDHEYDDHDPKFKLLASKVTQISPLANQAFALHPSQRILAVVGLAVTSIWKYSEENTTLEVIYKYPLDNFSFSNCGFYVHGECRQSGQLVMIHIGSSLVDSSKSLGAPAQYASIGDDSERQQLIPRAAKDQKDVVTQSGAHALSRTLDSNTIVFGSSKGQAWTTVMQQYGTEGAIVLSQVFETGTAQTETLTRLPRSKSLQHSYSTIVAPVGDAAWFTLVLNKAAEDTYSVDNSPDFALPAVLERRLDSVAVHVEKRGLIESDENDKRRDTRRIQRF